MLVIKNIKECLFKIRTGDKEIGDKKLCVRYGPEKQRPLNLNATGLRDLIKWDLPTVKESPLTVNLSKVVCIFQIFTFLVIYAVTLNTSNSYKVPYL